jgi:polysaccharide export outer membrane protein
MIRVRLSQIFAPMQLVYSLIVLIAGCAAGPGDTTLLTSSHVSDVPDYIIAPGDTLAVFVWNNNDLSASVPVRPDGKITTPLVEDIKASGKTPSQLARDIEERLARFVKFPEVSVTVTDFVGRFSEQIRVIGEAAQPESIPYRERMTVLDVIIKVGGLTDFADGNKTVLVREIDGEEETFRLRLDDLINRGDISANVDMLPGDILIIPEVSWF